MTKPLDPISVLSFLHKFKKACGSNGIHESAAMWLSQHYMRGADKEAVVPNVCTTIEDDLQQEGKLKTCRRVNIYQHATYATDDILAEVEADTTNYK